MFLRVEDSSLFSGEPPRSPSRRVCVSHKSGPFFIIPPAIRGQIPDTAAVGPQTHQGQLGTTNSGRKRGGGGGGGLHTKCHVGREGLTSAGG